MLLVLLFVDHCTLTVAACKASDDGSMLQYTGGHQQGDEHMQASRIDSVQQDPAYRLAPGSDQDEQAAMPDFRFLLSLGRGREHHGGLLGHF